MATYFDFSDKNILITGAGQGIGHTLACNFMQAGARVALLDVNPSVLSVAEACEKEGHTCKAFIANVADDAQRRSSFAAAMEFFEGRIDVLINAAGIQRRHSCLDFPLEDWELVLDVNLTGTFGFSQLAGRVMAKQGYGKIINFCSILTFLGGQVAAAYASSKGGVAQLTKALSNEWAGKGINVNAVAPGYIETAINAQILSDEARCKEILSRIPAKRWGKPQDIVGPVFFLASEAANYISGAILPIDGGYLCR